MNTQLKNRLIIGKNSPKVGETPSIILCNPKYRHNVGAAIRAASCFGVKQVWYTGNRVELLKGERIPREERMKGYMGVDLINFDFPLERFANCTPVAIELLPGAEMLHNFIWPSNPVLLMGPEDGSLPKHMLSLAHRFVSIPTRHCTNLSAAIYICLYDRLVKRIAQGLDRIDKMEDIMHEDRYWLPPIQDEFLDER